MLMNGEKVNHLVVNGETFDKSFVNKKVKTKDVSGSDTIRIYDGINSDGGVFQYGSGNYSVYTGDMFIVLAKFMNYFYIANSGNPPKTNKTRQDKYMGFGWTSVNNIEMLDSITGGVNSPLYLLFLYCCLALLAWEVAFLC